jgi:nucleotide-binding universal stress UspA family protein
VDKHLQTAATVRANLAEMATDLVVSGLLEGAPNICVEIGDPATEIVAVAKIRQADLIVMTTHGYGAVKRTLFGSVTDRVVRSTSVPILVVRPRDEVAAGETGAFRRIVVALDGSTLAENALTGARELAQQLDVPITLVRAVHFNYMVPAVDGTIAVALDATEDMLGYAREYLTSVQETLAAEGLTVSIDVQLGLPFDVVDAMNQPGDLIILTSHGRGGLGRWLLGSVAEKLIRSARVPVLLVPVRTPI